MLPGSPRPHPTLFQLLDCFEQLSHVSSVSTSASFLVEQTHKLTLVECAEFADVVERETHVLGERVRLCLRLGRRHLGCLVGKVLLDGFEDIIKIGGSRLVAVRILLTKSL